MNRALPPATGLWTGAPAAPAYAWSAGSGLDAAKPALLDLHGLTMGTRWSVKLVAAAGALPRLERGIQARLDEVVAQMSTWDPGSDISRYNRAHAGSVQELPAEFARVLDAALTLAADTDGAYDPSIGPLTEAWGFGPGGTRMQAPDEQALARAHARIGWRRLGFDRAQRRLTQPGGVYLDLSSIAKGYGVDRVADWLLAQGVKDCLVEVGGELRGHGRKPDGSSWRIAVESPGGGDGPAAAVIALDALAIATSGDYRRYFDQDGRRYSHTLDPRSGAPIDNTVASVTVLHWQCMYADALATALSVLGAHAGMAYANRRQLAALFVLREGDGFVARPSAGFVAHQRGA